MSDKNRLNHWSQDQFYISTFEAIRNNEGDFRKILETTKEAGINLVEITFKDRASVTKVLEICEDLGIKTIVQDPSFGGIGEKMVVTDDAIIREAVEYYSRFKNIYGYYVWDEPIREAFLHCKETKDRFEKYAPGKLAYFALFPSYGVYTWTASNYNWESNTYVKYIDDFLDTVKPDVISFDYYPYRNGTTDIVKNDLWRDMGYLSKRARELKKPFWFYFQGVELTTGEIGGMNRQKISVQMYAALAYGAKGLSWFTSMGIITDIPGNKTELFDDMKDLNEQVMNLGRILFDKNVKKIYHTNLGENDDAIYYLDSLDSSNLINAAPNDLIISEFEDGLFGQKYILVVNKQDRKRCYGELSFKVKMGVAEFDKKKNTLGGLVRTDTISLDLSGGESVLFMIP